MLQQLDGETNGTTETEQTNSESQEESKEEGIMQEKVSTKDRIQ
jgi:hypothetical protein